MSKNGWMIYGANGLAGRQVAEEAMRLGERPILAGRSADKVRRVAEELGLPWVAFDLANRGGMVAALEKVELVMLAAGPFDGLAQPMMDACLEAGTHYADLANEIAVLQAAEERHAKARGRGIVIVSGIGFGTIASGTLAKRVASALPDATHLEAALHIATSTSGAGTAMTGVAAIENGGRVRRNGALVAHALGADGRRIRFADATRRAAPVPMGDLEAAFMDTRVPNVTIYSTALSGGFFQRWGIAILRKLLRIPMVRRAASNIKEGASENLHCEVWARATNDKGESVEAWMETGEGFAFTAAAAARAIAKIRQSSLRGAYAPATLLGTSFAETIPGVRVFTALEREATETAGTLVPA